MLEQQNTSCGRTCSACTCGTNAIYTGQPVTTKQHLVSCCAETCACKPQASISQTPTPHHRPPSQDVTNHIFYLAGRCGVTVPGESQDRLFETISWLYRDMAPVGAMQALLVSQITSAFLIAQTQLHASTSEADLQAINIRVGMASKLMKVMNLQLNLLATLKGMKVQSVKVEHLNVNGNSVIGIGGHVEQGRYRG